MTTKKTVEAKNCGEQVAVIGRSAHVVFHGSILRLPATGLP